MVEINMLGKDGKYSFEDFVEIIRILRSPEGCPWDREQTHKSIRNEFIEETYEAADAIDNENSVDLCEELGDVLLQIALHSQIASEAGEFDFTDVIDGVARKMILRHPHVFGSVKVDSTDDVLNNWDKIKKVEKSQANFTETLKSVPMAYPALMRCAKVQKRAGKAGVDESIYGASLIAENPSGADLKENLGRILFSLVSVARGYGLDPEECLNRQTDEFIKKFESLEQRAEEKGGLDRLSHEKIAELWER